MFFEEESKDTHGNMDDYDLNFEQDESVSWDKLLDDNASEDDPLGLLSDEDSEGNISSADNLLDMDDESFENFIEEQKQNIIKNKEKEEAEAKKAQEPEEVALVEELKIEETAKPIENNTEEVLEAIESKMQEEIAQETEDTLELEEIPNNTSKVSEEENTTSLDEDTTDVQEAFGVKQEETEEGEKSNEEDYTQDDYEYENNQQTKKSNPFVLILLVVVVVFAGGLFAFNKFVGSQDVAFDASSIADIVDMQQPQEPLEMPDINVPGETPQPAKVELKKDASQDPALQTTETKATVKVADKKQDKKEDKKAKKEEKINLKIVDSGRQTPFVPVAGLNNLGFATSPRVEIAKPFETLGEPDPMLGKLMNIVVSGILYDGSQNPSAVINVEGVDYFVQKGDKIDTFTVIGITQDTVVIKEKNNIFSATIGQNFTNSGRITGQIQTINTVNRQVQRQYTTLEDVEINIK